MKTKLSVIFLVVITAIGACKKENECVTGNNNIIQDTRDVGEYHTVAANGSFNLTFAQTSIYQVDLFGESNILPLIKTTVSNDRLTIGSDGSTCYTTNNTVEVTLSSPLITSISLNGAGQLNGHGITQDDLAFITNGAAVINSSFTVKNFESNINGSGDASYAGTAENATLTITGAGNIYASTLSTNKCTVVISGAGDVRILVNDELNVTISGSGNVYYSGNPTVNTNITGTGQVIKR